MIEWLSFQNKDLLLPIVVTSIILWGIFIWKEFRLIKEPRFFIRVLVALIILFCIDLLILKPQSQKDRDFFSAVLLTENYNPRDLDSLEKIHPKLQKIKYTKNERVFPDSLDLNMLYILGNGIEPYDFWRVENIPVTYKSGQLPKGLSRIQFTSDLELGEQLLISGQINNPDKDNYVYLEGPTGLGLDSVKLKGETSENFQLRHDLSVPGKFIYSLVLKDSLGAIIAKNPIPIKIKDLEPLQILILNTYPNFETKYLKNYLAEQGHKIIIRSQLTKGLYKYEYFNLPRTPMDRFSEESLKPFDLIIMDLNSLSGLGAGDRTILENAMREDGLGIFIQPSLAVFGSNDSFIQNSFSRTSRTRTEKDDKYQQIYQTFPFKYDSDLTINPILKIKNDTVSAFLNIGRGKVGTSVIDKTYELVINGNNQAYQYYWTRILNDISKKPTSLVEWQKVKFLDYENERFDFQLRTSVKNPIVLRKDDEQIQLLQDPELEYLWNGAYFPHSSGWKEISLSQDSTQNFNFYVYKDSDWASVRQKRNIKLNLNEFTGKDLKPKHKINVKPIDLTYIYIIVLIGLAYLWLAPKLGRKFI